MSAICRVMSVVDDCYTNDVELKEVFIDTITNPKNISKVVLQLKSMFPIPELNHLKRVKGKEVLLFPSGNLTENEVHTILRKKNFEVDFLKNDVRKIKVAATSPLVRQQYTKCHSIWPCNFHSDKYLEKLTTNTLFSDDELRNIWNFMEIAKEIGTFSKSPVKDSGVVVVDPDSNSIVAVGYDKSIEGPCRHGIMVAIDNVSKTQKGGTWIESNGSAGQTNTHCNGIPGDVLISLKDKFKNVNFGSSVIHKCADSDGPYLCTGYDVYTSREPCIMCAMALIHSRAKRVFYEIPSANGALGTLCKIHTVNGLNHHYEVFVVHKVVE